MTFSTLLALLLLLRVHMNV